MVRNGWRAYVLGEKDGRTDWPAAATEPELHGDTGIGGRRENPEKMRGMAGAADEQARYNTRIRVSNDQDF